MKTKRRAEEHWKNTSGNKRLNVTTVDYARGQHQPTRFLTPGEDDQKNVLSTTAAPGIRDLQRPEQLYDTQTAPRD